MLTLRHYIENDNVLKFVIFDMFKDEYNNRIKLAGHWGRYYDNALNWYDRNVEFNFSKETKKYVGFHLIMWDAKQKQIYFDAKYMDYKVNSTKHAKFLLAKIMKENKFLINEIKI